MAANTTQTRKVRVKQGREYVEVAVNIQPLPIEQITKSSKTTGNLPPKPEDPSK